jgi:hypothetical protein
MATFVFKLTPVGIRGGQEFIYTHYIAQTGDVPDLEDSILDAYEGSVVGDWRAIHTSGFVLDRVDCQRIVPKDQVEKPAVVSRAIGLAGIRSASGDVLATWLAIAATIHTATGGRRRRGRNSFTGGHEGDVTTFNVDVAAGSWHARCGEYLQTLANTFDDIAGQGQWSVFSRTNWNELMFETEWTRPVTSWVVHTTLRTMKSRGPE